MAAARKKEAVNKTCRGKNSSKPRAEAAEKVSAERKAKPAVRKCDAHKAVTVVVWRVRSRRAAGFCVVVELRLFLIAEGRVVLANKSRKHARFAPRRQTLDFGTASALACAIHARPPDAGARVPHNERAPEHTHCAHSDAVLR